MDADEALPMLKALSNETRLNIVRWLRDPEASFGHLVDRHTQGLAVPGSACTGIICERAGIGQSTGSTFLAELVRAGLLESERHGRHTYFRRDEANIARLAEFLGTDL